MARGLAETAVIVSGSPSMSRSLPSTAIGRVWPASAKTVSATATGGVLTVTDTAAVATAPRPSLIV